MTILFMTICMWLHVPHFIFISLPAPDKVKLTTEGDLSFFAKQDEVSISPNIIYQCISILSMYPFYICINKV